MNSDIIFVFVSLSLACYIEARHLKPEDRAIAILVSDGNDYKAIILDKKIAKDKQLRSWGFPNLPIQKYAGAVYQAAKDTGLLEKGADAVKQALDDVVGIPVSDLIDMGYDYLTSSNNAPSKSADAPSVSADTPVQAEKSADTPVEAGKSADTPVDAGKVVQSVSSDTSSKSGDVLSVSKDSLSKSENAQNATGIAV